MSYFSFYSNVKLVRGYNRAVIMDLMLRKTFFIPVYYYDLFKSLDFIDKSLEEILDSFTNEDDTTALTELIKFSLDNNLGLIANKETVIGLIPNSDSYYPSNEIQNSIIEIDSSSSWGTKNLASQLNALGTKFLEVRFLDFEAFKTKVSDLLNSFSNTTVESIEILVPYNEVLKEILDDPLLETSRLTKIIVYNASTGFEISNNKINILFSSQDNIDSSGCGQIRPEYFTIDNGSFIYNQHYNNCLAFKLSIDKNGDIKNCPSSNISYGNVNDVRLFEVIKNTDFKQYWEVTKEKIFVCSDCEFRMMCSDCRVFTNSTLNNYSKPSKCSYNPYISLWEWEDKYVKMEDCGIIFEQGQMKINHEHIEKINQSIWES